MRLIRNKTENMIGQSRNYASCVVYSVWDGLILQWKRLVEFVLQVFGIQNFLDIGRGRQSFGFTTLIVIGRAF